MKDVTITDFGQTVGAGFCTINGTKIYYTGCNQLLSHIYNALVGLDISGKTTDFAVQVVKRCTNKEELLKIKEICENKLFEGEAEKSTNPSDKWDGFTIVP